MFEQLKLAIEKKVDKAVSDFWTPNTPETVTLANDLREHVQKLKLKVDADEVELRIAQVNDELGQLESDLIVAEAEDNASDAKAIEKMIAERSAELSRLNDDLKRRKSDVLNPKTLAFKANPLLVSLKKDALKYDATVVEVDAIHKEIEDAIKFLKGLKKKLDESISPTVWSAGYHGTNHSVRLVEDMAEYLMPEDRKGSSDKIRGAELFDYVKTFEAPTETAKYAFFKKK